MELTHYIRTIVSRGWLIILMMVLTCGAAYGFSKMQVPIYKSTAQILISSRPDNGQTQATRSLLQTYAKWFQSSLRTQQAIDLLQLDMHPDELLGNLRVTASTDSNIITLEVENTNPDVANDIARTLGDLFIQWRNEANAALRQEDRITAEFLDTPKAGLDRPQTKINTIAGAVMGVLLGICLAFLLEWLDSRFIRFTADIETHLGVPVLAQIQDAQTG